MAAGAEESGGDGRREGRMRRLVEWSVEELEKLGFPQLHAAVEYVLELNDEADARSYLQALIPGSDSGDTRAFVERFLDVAFRDAPLPSSSTAPRDANSTAAADTRATAAPHAEAASSSQSRGGANVKALVAQARASGRPLNCLHCGKIHRLVPSDGRCEFCQRQLFDENDGVVAESVLESRDRLLSFDRDAARRTVVHDDHSDYFESSSSAWLSQEEIAELERTKHEREREEQRRDKQLEFTIDVAGRRLALQPAAAATDSAAAPPRDADDSENDDDHHHRRSEDSTQSGDGFSDEPAGAFPSLGLHAPRFVRSERGASGSSASTPAAPPLSGGRVQRERRQAA